MSVAARIKKRRDKLGMTQTQLAKAAKLTPAAISQFESGAPQTGIRHTFEPRRCAESHHRLPAR